MESIVDNYLIDFFYSIKELGGEKWGVVLMALAGGLFTWILTALGASLVFFLNQLTERF